MSARMTRSLPAKHARALHASELLRAGAWVVAATTLALLVGPVSVASAAQPTVTITKPSSGSTVHSRVLKIAGEISDEFDPAVFGPVVVKIYPPEGQPIEESVKPELTETGWSTTVTLPSDGQYTATAEQSEIGNLEPPGKGEVAFRVLTSAPAPRITYPVNGSSAVGESQLLTGSAQTGHNVTVKLSAGSTTTELEVPVSANGSWSAVFAPLAPGTYTAEASQSNGAIEGTSLPVTFTLTASPVHTPPLPVASFTWFPVAPVVGQTVVLVSSSTDAASPITGLAWDLAGGGPFKAGAAALSTSFATPGNHVVRLQVIDAAGRSSLAAETIPVSAPPLRLMQPFPIVRIAGVKTATGVRLSVVSVQAPVGAHVTVTCRGRGCKTRPQSRIATASKRNVHASSVVLTFRSFERSFRAGVSLEVRVAAAGELGKYTLFAIHRRSLPTRVDECLSGVALQPIACAQ
jgi:hypothetical protein